MTRCQKSSFGVDIVHMATILYTAPPVINTITSQVITSLPSDHSTVAPIRVLTQSILVVTSNAHLVFQTSTFVSTTLMIFSSIYLNPLLMDMLERPQGSIGSDVTIISSHSQQNMEADLSTDQLDLEGFS